MPKPRYRDLAEKLIADIRAGVLPVGERLAGELDLVQQYNVSRHTVRESLRMLEDLGLIERIQGLGTVVRAREVDQTYAQVVHSPAELMQYPADSQLRVIDAEPVRASQALARTLGCRRGSEWQRIRTVRSLSRSGLAICASDIYVLPQYADVATRIGQSERPVYAIIERNFDVEIKRVEIDFRAGLISAHAAAELDVAPDSPALTLVRRYVGDDGQHFEISVSEHPADRFTYSMKLQRGWSSGGGWSGG